MFYFYTNLVKLIEHDDNYETFYQEKLNITEIQDRPEIYYANETSVTSFYILNKQTVDGEIPLEYDDDMKKYINLRFDGYSINYITGEFNFTYVDARKCDKEKDFGRNE